jgi:hypothetical protein
MNCLLSILSSFLAVSQTSDSADSLTVILQHNKTKKDERLVSAMARHARRTIRHRKIMERSYGQAL